jgi:hypothetical protein
VEVRPVPPRTTKAASDEVYRRYVEGAKDITTHQTAVASAERRLERAQQDLDQARAGVTEAQDRLRKVVDELGEDPLGLLRAGVGGGSTNGAGRGEVQDAILGALGERPDQSFPELVQSVGHKLGREARPASVTVAIASLLKRSAISRSGKPRSYRYSVAS